MSWWLLSLLGLVGLVLIASLPLLLCVAARRADAAYTRAYQRSIQEDNDHAGQPWFS